jgi:hypothetical protein
MITLLTRFRKRDGMTWIFTQANNGSKRTPALAIKALANKNQLRQVKNTTYKLQRQVEKAMVLPEYKDL